MKFSTIFSQLAALGLFCVGGLQAKTIHFNDGELGFIFNFG